MWGNCQVQRIYLHWTLTTSPLGQLVSPQGLWVQSKIDDSLPLQVTPSSHVVPVAGYLLWTSRPLAKPSSRQTTSKFLLGRFQPVLHTEPHSPLWYTSRRPSNEMDDPANRTTGPPEQYKVCEHHHNETKSICFGKDLSNPSKIWSTTYQSPSLHMAFLSD